MARAQEGNARADYLHQEYRQRVNRAIDYIDANTGSNLSLAALADIAVFSRLHFHRIFRAMMGETLNEFIQRLRVEKAATRLVNNPRDSITEIALGCGFSSSAGLRPRISGIVRNECHPMAGRRLPKG